MSLISFTAEAYTLNNVGRINIIVGKNGCGKSTLLRKVDTHTTSINEQPVNLKYISPERGGHLVFKSGVEQQMQTNDRWVVDDRRKNQVSNFKIQAFTNFRMLETMVLRKAEKELRSDPTYTFDKYIDYINSLLDQIKMVRVSSGFDIQSKTTNEEISPENISSGESELISLAIECLCFEARHGGSENSFLLLDEPDVHLHPDLQARFMEFLVGIVQRSKIRAIVCTHSTPILSAIKDFSEGKLFLMKSGDKVIDFKDITEQIKVLLPIFGTHPLSSVFNKSPVLLVEGDDEVRIWNQAVRSSKGEISIFPCPTGSVDNLRAYEEEANRVIDAVYENGVGYSLRDGDGITEGLENLTNIKRYRLNCYSSENLLLTDEVLSHLNTSWDVIVNQFDKWIESNPEHQYYSDFKSFKDSDYNRKRDIKSIRNIVVGITDSSKPWEVIVGQTIAKLDLAKQDKYDSPTSIYNFLGKDLINAVFN
jgi:energy-coupling factor transporter ATP-binding protein EcfA2